MIYFLLLGEREKERSLDTEIKTGGIGAAAKKGERGEKKLGRNRTKEQKRRKN